MSERICIECSKEVAGRYIRQHCRPCYRRMMRASKPKMPRVSRARHPGERVLARSVAGPSGCVIYTGTHDKHGYGEVNSGPERGGRPMRAYRATYEYVVGPVPTGLDLDHTCHSEDLSCPGGSGCLHRRCVNPNHLEPVTRSENVKRGRTVWAMRARQTHCKRGHEFTPENLLPTKNLRTDGTPQRACRTCHGENRRRRQQAAEPK